MEEPLNKSLTASLLPEARVTLAQDLWGRPSPRTFVFSGARSPETAIDPFFKYYVKQCNLIALHNNGQYSALTTHQQIINVAALFRHPRTRPDILTELAKLFKTGTADQHENTLHLVSRLLTMIRIGDVPHEFLGGRHLDWKDGTLTDFVHGYFSDTPVLGHERIKFEKMFNALNLVRIAGLEIQWTDNLADHLRLVHDDRVLRVFHHAVFLSAQKSSSLFPPNFIAETLRTLALLFPKYDKKMRAWFTVQATKHALDPEVMSSGHLIADERQVENFVYWHDRLVVLKQVYDESRPRTISQWWHDRRNGVQWYTFWVAILVLFLTVFFGLVQSIEGAIQVHVSLHPS
jgi:hypothetical protein